MKSKLLIEQQNRAMWRVVIRECTATGFSPTQFRVVGDNYPRYLQAWYLFDEVNVHRRRKAALRQLTA